MVHGVTSAIVMEKIGRSVLCVIDFSDASEDALKTAVDIAVSTKSRLSVLYAYRLTQPRNISEVAHWKKNIDMDARNSFNRMSKTLFSESGVIWEFKSEVGFIDDRVEAYTEKNSVGMIVISNELSRGNKDALTDMLDKLKCPLLIVPEKQKQES